MPGARGPEGARGLQGAAGQAPTLSTLTEYSGPLVTIPPLGAEASIAECPAGSRAVSGEHRVDTPAGDGAAVSQATDDARTSWAVVAANHSTTTEGTVRARVLCAGTGQAVAAGPQLARRRAAVERKTRAIAEALEARMKADRKAR